MLHADGGQRLTPEMTPAFVGDMPSLGFALFRKGRGEVAHGQTVPAAQDAAPQVAETCSPSPQRLIGPRADGADDGAIQNVFDTLQERVLAAAAHRKMREAIASSTSG